MSDKSGPKRGHFLPGGVGEAPAMQTTEAGTPGAAGTRGEAPKPGHFLPGGTGETSGTTSGTAAPRPQMAKPRPV